MALCHTKIGFPNHFLKAIKSLYTKIIWRILINSYLTKPINMEKRIRKGWPSKMSLFFQGIRTPGRRIVKSVSCADDTIKVIGKPARCATFNTLTGFRKASGLQLNLSKTQGLYFQHNTISYKISLIISWKNKALEILGLVIGSANSV